MSSSEASRGSHDPGRDPCQRGSHLRRDHASTAPIFDDNALKQHADELITLLTNLKTKTFDRPQGQDDADSQGQTGDGQSGPETRPRVVSKKKQSSMQFNLAQLQKKKLISSNVDRVKNMNLDDFEELMDETCGKTGVLWLNLNTELLPGTVNLETPFDDFCSLFRSSTLVVY
jgi:hypothetical protein